MTMPKFEPFCYLRQTASEKNPPHGWAVHFSGGEVSLHNAAQLTEVYEAGKRDAIPEGWVLVPKEPNYFELQEVSEVHGLDYNKFCAAYKEAILRMLAAAPKGEE